MNPQVSLKVWELVFLIFSFALADYIHTPNEHVLLNFPSQEELFVKILALIIQGNKRLAMKYASYRRL